MSDLTERLKQRLRYEPETGKFYWKNFGSRSGQKAGSTRKDGYIGIRVDGKYYLAHRLAWFMTFGEWPGPHLDHINRNPSDNRINNLRSSCAAENAMNRGLNTNNTTGVRGVSKVPYGYTLRVREKHIGFYKTLDEARKAAEVYHV